MSSSEDHSMSFGDHLEELRKRVMWAMALPVPVMLVAYFFSDPLLDLLLRPLFVVLAGQGLRPEVLLLEPIELFFTQIKLAMLAGVVLGAPWIVYQLWLFVKPGLHQHERRFVNLLLPGSAILTILSVLLTYLVMLPFMLQVLVAIGANMTVHIPPIPVPAQAAEIIKAHEGQPLQTYLGKPANVAAGDIWLDVRDQKVRLAYNDAAGTQVVFDVPPTVEGGFRQDYRLNEYISFVLMLLLGMAIAAQLPVVVMLLGWIGMVTPEFLRKNRRYALFLTAVAAAVITPTGDPFSLLLLWVPLYGLYELGLILLVLAPAHAVAEGRVISRIWRRSGSDKSGNRASKSTRTSQMNRPVARGSSSEDEANRRTDAEEGDE